MPDWSYPAGLFAALTMTTLLWLPRLVTGRAPTYARTEAAGGSRLVGKQAKTMMYWAFQPIGRGLVALGISANAITWSAGVFGLAAAWCMAVGRPGLGSCVVTLAFVADALDGLVARQTGTATAAGEVLDAVVDRYVEFSWFAGVIVWYRADLPRMLLALAALIGAQMVSYMTAKAEAMSEPVPDGAMRRAERAVCIALGSALTAFTLPFPSFWRDRQIPADWPLLVALGLIALLGNQSTWTRGRVLMATLRKRG